VDGWHRLSLDEGRAGGCVMGEGPIKIAPQDASMIARCARSPSMPACSTHRFAAAGIDRSARPSKQERPCFKAHV
jgi:hypothetical protein